MDAGENEITLASYDAVVEAYLTKSAPEPRQLTADLMRVVPAGTSVLEIGSGPGSDALHLRSAGYLVQTTDASLGFLEHLHASGFPDARRYDLDLDAPPAGDWDAVYANAVLHHLRRDRLGPALARLRRSLRSDVPFIASTKTGRSDGWTEEKLGSPRWFTYWEAAELETVLSVAGWRVESLEQRVGARDVWIDLVLRA